MRWCADERDAKNTGRAVTKSPAALRWQSLAVLLVPRRASHERAAAIPAGKNPRTRPTLVLTRTIIRVMTRCPGCGTFSVFWILAKCAAWREDECVDRETRGVTEKRLWFFGALQWTPSEGTAAAGGSQLFGRARRGTGCGGGAARRIFCGHLHGNLSGHRRGRPNAASAN